MNEMDLTVAICAYNAAQRIGMVLDSLAGQRLEGVRWELLVIDNASTDGTARVAEEIGRRLGLPLRVLHEPEPGLSNARRKAALEARAEVISFLDDDNAVGPDWVSQCHQFMAEHPAVGIVGARVVPIFEDPAHVPADFQERFAGLLSMYDQGDAPKRIRVGVDPLPVGAGMTGRREIFRFVFDELGSVAVGRKGQSLAGGEDIEAMYIAHRLGWEIWYSPALRAEHFVPSRKLTEEYWNRWCIDTATCHAWLEVLSNRESRSLWRWWRRRLQFDRLILKYALLGLLPALRCTGGKSAKFWRQFYQSKAAGWGHLVRGRNSILHVLRRVDEQALPIAGAATTPLAGTT